MDKQTTHIPQTDIDRQLAYCLEVKEVYDARGVKPLAFVDTYGCQQNEADSERIRGYLRQMGFDLLRAKKRRTSSSSTPAPCVNTPSSVCWATWAP